MKYDTARNYALLPIWSTVAVQGEDGDMSIQDQKNNN